MVAYVVVVTEVILVVGTTLEVATVNIISVYILVHYQAVEIVIVNTV